MYHDKKNGRILLRDGTSVLSSYGYAKNIINGKEDENVGVKVARDYDSEAYDFHNQTDLAVDIEEKNPEPKSHIHSDEELNRLIDCIESSDRLCGTDEEIDRIEYELEYFTRTNNVKFLLKCIDLLEEFRDNGVVWGVGRGSSCASYIAYLLKINDIDPIKFDIDFRELSKE
jgi:hypothetical protein